MIFVNAALLSDTIYYMERREISVRYEEFLPQRLTQLRMQRNVSARDMSLSLGQANNYINSIENRKALYTEEGRQYYHGSLIVPDDLETLEL